jgi:mono/diheme cytochrome c family protein
MPAAVAAALLLTTLAPAEARADDVVLPESLRPFLATHCVDCHDGARGKGGLDLAATLASGHADASVLRSLRKRLVKRDMPPADEPERPPEAAYVDAIAAISAVVPLEEREVPAARRLNRAQYAGAVRDVLGVSASDARELLPADEIGEGFDTTASTLALPPLLIEKYLDAAERIAELCVPPASWSRVQSVPPERFERKGQGGTYDGVAWLATVGTLTARIDLAHAGRYRVMIDACGQFAGSDDPRLEVLVNGAKVADAAITAAAGSTQQVVAEVTLPQGACRVSARFSNDFWDPKAADPKRRDRNLGVARIALEGPLGETADTAFELRVRALAGDGADVLRLRRVAAAIGEELFRRPLTQAEANALAATAREAVGPRAPFDDQLRVLVTALLADPRFLLRVELPPSTQAATGRQPLAPHELASRLSFFLWSSVPDAELRRAAQAGELAEPAAIAAQVRRMLADPRASSLSERFASQWLGIDGLEARQLDPALFPAVDAALLADMRRETELLFDEVVRGALPVRALLASRSTRLNARLAAHYGVPAPQGDAWERRDLATERASGVLGHASVLVATSNPTRTSPVKRGKWVMQALLDDAPPPPPPGVPQLPERPEDTKGLSIRELMAMHRANPDCASCHVKMDAIGLAFEASDADGRLRSGFDDTSELPDGSILRGARGVEEMLARDQAFERSLARQLLVYALGRGTAEADDALVDALAARLRESGSFAALAESIALSDAFRTRRTFAKAGDRALPARGTPIE